MVTASVAVGEEVAGKEKVMATEEAQALAATLGSFPRLLTFSCFPLIHGMRGSDSLHEVAPPHAGSMERPTSHMH